MIATIGQACQAPENRGPHFRQTTVIKISLVVFEILLVATGAALYFSGVGVIPASLVAGSAVLVEIGALAYDLSQKIALSKAIKQKEKELADATFKRLAPALENLGLITQGDRLQPASIHFFESLIEKKIVTLDFTVQRGLKLVRDKYTPPEEKRSPHFSNLIYHQAQVLKCSEITNWLYVTQAPQDEESETDFLKVFEICDRHPIVVRTNLVYETKIVDGVKKEGQKVCEEYLRPAVEGNNIKEGQLVLCKDEDEESDETDYVLYNNKGAVKAVTHHRLIRWENGCEYPKCSLDDLQAKAIEILRAIREENGTLFVLDATGTGRAGAFAVCVLLEALNQVSRQAAVGLNLDLPALIDFLRNNPSHGRKDLIDQESYYTTISAYVHSLIIQ